MSAADANRLPDVAEVLAPVLARIPRERQPLLIAFAERLAAERYRGWAAEPSLTAQRGELLACARREEEIASRIEALHANATAVQQQLLAADPRLEAINRDLFAGRPLRDQLLIQARGERLGAATWRAFARDASPEVSATFEACALLEEESAAVLEGILARDA